MTPKLSKVKKKILKQAEKIIGLNLKGEKAKVMEMSFNIFISSIFFSQTNTANWNFGKVNESQYLSMMICKNND